MVPTEEQPENSDTETSVTNELQNNPTYEEMVKLYDQSMRHLSEGEIVADGSPAVLQEAHAGATLETMFRELTIDGQVEDLARRFLETAHVAE